MSDKHQSKRWFSIFHPEKFHLMLYYSITSFVVIGIVSFVVGEVFSRIEKNDLIERSEKYAGYIVNHINLEMYEAFFVPSMDKYGYIDLENNKEQFNSLDKIIKSNIYGFNLRGICNQGDDAVNRFRIHVFTNFFRTAFNMAVPAS